MATRQKTIQHAFTTLASLTNNTLTNLTQTTIYIPESGLTFRSVIAVVSLDDICTVAGNSTTRTVALRLGAAGYTTDTDSGGTPALSRNQSQRYIGDFTAHFVSNWTGTSMTCDCQVKWNQSSGTTLGMSNICVTLEITYDYDDTSATQIKTIIRPLNASVAALTTSPTTYDTIPEIGYWLAESSKVFRNVYVVVDGNTANAALTSDHTLSIAVGATNTTTQTYVGALASSRRFRYVWELSGSWPSTTATQAFQLSDTVGRNNHIQAWLVVTYEFKANATATTLTSALTDGTGTTVAVTDATLLGTSPYVITIENEQMLVTSVASNNLTVTRAYNGTTGVAHANGLTVTPCATNSVQLHGTGLSEACGGYANTDYQRFTTTLYIEEPGPITAGAIAFNLFWPGGATISGLNARVGAGSFITYTDNVTNTVGSCGLMCRNDAAFTLSRGKNIVTFDVYATDSASGHAMNGLSGHWLITYVSTKSASGYGAHNTTRRFNVGQMLTTGGVPKYLYTAISPDIPENDYYISAVGIEGLHICCTVAGGANYLLAFFEILGAEGGILWAPLVGTQILTGASGANLFGMDMTNRIKRWPLDTCDNRVDIETARRYRFLADRTIYYNMQQWVTYHSCGPFLASGTVSNSGGGTVTLGLHRSSDGQLLKSTTRSGNGAYSFNWFDNTENVFVEATEDATHLGRSTDALATGSA